MGDSNFVAAANSSGIIAVVVKPNSSKNEIVGYDSERKAWIVKVKAAAEKGKANRELLRFLKKETGKAWMIKSGSRSHETQIAAAIGPSRPLPTWETLIATSS